MALDNETVAKILSFTRDEMKECYDLLKHRSFTLSQEEKSQFKVGDEVYWISKKQGKRIDGVLTKVMKKNCKVLVGFQEWTVHPSFLKLNDTLSLTQEDVTKLNGAITVAAQQFVAQNEKKFNPMTGDFE